MQHNAHTTVAATSGVLALLAPLADEKDVEIEVSLKPLQGWCRITVYCSDTASFENVRRLVDGYLPGASSWTYRSDLSIPKYMTTIGRVQLALVCTGTWAKHITLGEVA